MGTIRKFKTWLPVFIGFNDTIFDCDVLLECDLDNLNEQKDTKDEITIDDVIVDYEGYRKSVGKACTKYIKEKLQKLGLVSNIRFEGISSPKEYNFETDSINCEITVNKRMLREYLGLNAIALSEYLKERYTSRAGFGSFYSNDIEEWKTKTIGFRYFNEHELGALLQFVCLNEDINYGDMYEETNCYYELNVKLKK